MGVVLGVVVLYIGPTEKNIFFVVACAVNAI